MNSVKNIPQRFSWAADYIEAKHADVVLEIGCGAGILIEQLIARGVKDVTGVEKSAAMITLARKRNREAIKDGGVTLMKATISEMRLKNNSFDKIVAFNVNIFRKGSAEELQAVRSALKPGGRLFVFYQFPKRITVEAAEPISCLLVANGFVIESVELGNLTPNVLAVKCKRDGKKR